MLPAGSAVRAASRGSKRFKSEKAVSGAYAALAVIGARLRVGHGIKAFLASPTQYSLARRTHKVTVDQLWQAIAQNTNAMAALIHQQLELDPAVNTPNGIIRQAKLRESNTERIAKLERNYREYTAELSRRYSLE